MTQMTLPNLLSTLTESLQNSSSSFPDPGGLAAPTDGISLFDTKNELLLAYLQNLVYLIILNLRNTKQATLQIQGENPIEDVTKKLIELRVYLEKGVRPLEGKLRYQLDKLLAAASEADTANNHRNTSALPPRALDDQDSDFDPHPPSLPISELSHRPNPSAFVLPSSKDSFARQEKDEIYKPPRITPTSLPTTERKAERTRRPRRSTAVDAFIREEMTDAPVAEPSIGAGSKLRGKEKEREDERREYEEQRLVRLPGEKKKKQRRIGGGAEELDVGGFGALEQIDFGDTKGRKKRRVGGDGAFKGMGGRPGERWEKRVAKGPKRKRR
ncbi:uncharacterized protein KY384_007086 [Bacidia gigantensis]|uniref:uncharacterized protein n=1 Tax=Bacidia gigantensis TaxID=2732470 RepID=UPI001D03C760|nr:uncharacterized protein KY384_007086 [Bacidia gigantensis]KAG8528169.1 hypothetical protein KY384_007086 [Bacidia gigantensis]